MNLPNAKTTAILGVSVFAGITLVTYLYINDIYKSMKKPDKDE